jgi:hypothetical protein
MTHGALLRHCRMSPPEALLYGHAVSIAPLMYLEEPDPVGDNSRWDHVGPRAFTHRVHQTIPVSRPDIMLLWHLVRGPKAFAHALP